MRDATEGNDNLGFVGMRVRAGCQTERHMKGGPAEGAATFPAGGLLIRAAARGLLRLRPASKEQAPARRRSRRLPGGGAICFGEVNDTACQFVRIRKRQPALG